MAQPTPMRDRYNLPLTTTSGDAVQMYIDGLDRALSGNIGAEILLAEATQVDEGFAMAHAALAAHLSRLRQPEQARASAEAAMATSGGLSRRERQHIDIIYRSLNGDGPNALRLAREHLDDFPSDVHILQQFTGLMSSSGSKERIRQTLDEIEQRESAYGDDWFYLGLRSFYLHESDRFEESRIYSERSLQGNPRNGNASHNLAHVFYETSDYSGGLEFLNDWIIGYSDRAPFFSHLNWHMALFELTQGRYARAQEIYEQCIRPSVLEKAGGLGPPLADATSLLWRMELYGKGVSARDWNEVRAFAADQAANPGVAFQDAHAALALAATQDQSTMNVLLDGLKRMSRNGNSFVDDVVWPLVKGIEAFGREAYDDTIRYMEPINDRIIALGGSQAQRAVFHDTLLQAYLRTQRYEHAEAMLRKRLEHRHSARDFYWLACAQSSAGKADDAQFAARQAQHLWAGAEPASPELTELSRLVLE
ncbi:MAG: hypothetical protein H0V47_10685 [Chloroflexia bacterium]|nr:hypothetical protein [Chloroflexia bacterium]